MLPFIFSACRTCGGVQHPSVLRKIATCSAGHFSNGAYIHNILYYVQCGAWQEEGFLLVLSQKVYSYTVMFTAVVGLYPLVACIHALRVKRNKNEKNKEPEDQFHEGSVRNVFGWPSQNNSCQWCDRRLCQKLRILSLQLSRAELIEQYWANWVI